MNARSSSRLACLATWLSGVACTIYQLAWMRELASVTTAATLALILVVAAFMGGLGLGAWAGGRLVRRVSRPLRVYAYAELSAAMLFLVGIPLLGGSLHFHGWLIDLGATGPVALGIQLTAVGIYLVICTTLLGLALPLLVAGLERRSETAALIQRDAAYSFLYGMNTFGAVAGAIACGYVFIEILGLDRSIVLGVTASLGSAVCAFVLAGSSTSDVVVRSASSPGGDHRTSWRVFIITFATGAVALGAEVVWTRMFSLVVLNTVYAYTQVLAAVLIGIALAGFVTARVTRRILLGEYSSRRLLSVVFAALLGAAIWMACVPSLVHALGATKGFAGAAASGRSVEAMVILVAVLMPSSGLLALVLPLLIGVGGTAETSRTLARLFAINTLGAVLGTLATGLLFLPVIGLGGSQLVLSLSIVGIAALTPSGQRGWPRYAILAGAVAAVVGLHQLVSLPGDLYALRFEEHESILDYREGITSDVIVTEDRANRRRIWINSSWVAGTSGAHSLLGHLPALAATHLDRAMGIALGTGQTFGAVVEHGARHLDCVEINADVVELARRWFAPFNHNLFDRPGVEVHVADGRAFLRSTRDRYDLIVLEPLQAWSAGTTALYTREFYEEASHVLRDGGVLAQWIPFYGQDTAATKAMVRTAIDVFPNASLWFFDRDAILLLDKGTFVLPWPKLRDSQLPALVDVRKRWHLEGAQDLLSLFMMGPRGLAEWTTGAAVLEDDRPFLEYVAARQLGEDPFTAILASTMPALEDPADYLPPGSLANGDAVRARAAALTRALCTPDRFARCATSIEAELATPTDSQRLHYEYRQLILAWATGETDLAAREAAYRRGIAHDDDFGEAMVNLAILLAERGSFDDAEVLAERARAIPRTRDTADRVLAKLHARH
ncbi:MAG TPA: hypothetical protein VMJ10_30455 [Kofleriaceae bacterium]|nr:hypothetical protein [Kofleriaceae bacterium]